MKDNGFTITESMVSMAMLTIAGTAGLNFFSQGIQVNRNIASEKKAISTFYKVNNFLQNSQNCSAVLQGLDFPEPVDNKIPDIILPNPLQVLGGFMPAGENLSLSSVAITNIGSPRPGSSIFNGSLRLVLQKSDTTPLGSKFIKKDVPIRFQVSDRKIKGCPGTDLNLQFNCTVMLGGIWVPGPPRHCTFKDNLEEICSGAGGTYLVGPPESCVLGVNLDDAKTLCESSLGGSYDENEKKCILSDISEICASLGGTYNTSTNSCQFGQEKSPQEVCEFIGGTFVNSKCQTNSSVADLCASLGTNWNWDGSKCIPSSGSGLPPGSTYTLVALPNTNSQCNAGDVFDSIQTNGTYWFFNVSPPNTYAYCGFSGNEAVDCKFNCLKNAFLSSKQSYIRTCHNGSFVTACPLACNPGDSMVSNSAIGATIAPDIFGIIRCLKNSATGPSHCSITCNR